MTNRIRSLTKLLLTGFIGLFIAACGGVGETKDPIESEPFFQAPEDEWQLVWSDEFDGTTLNTANWGFDLGDGSDRGLQGWGNQEAQWYTPDNIEVSDGTLKITARAEEVVAGFPYTSSRITTKDKVDFTYGRVEARIKAPAGQGMWAAFWMLSTNSPYGSDGWAATGEIDIFEAINPLTGGPLDFTGATIYHGFPFAFQQTLNQRYADLTRFAGFDATADFNTYAVEWEEKELRFFLNDVHIKTITNQSYYSYYYDEDAKQYTLAPDGAPFNTDFHIILNVAVGGTATGFEVDDAALPGAMEVDWVRVYRCSYDLPGGNGCNVNVDPEVVPQGTNDTGRVVANRPFVDSFDIYNDGPSTFTWNIAGEIFERTLALGSFDNSGAMTFAEVADADRGTVISATSTGGGNVFLGPDDGDPIGLFGMGNNPNFAELGAAEIRFDMLVNSADAGSQFHCLIRALPLDQLNQLDRRLTAHFAVRHMHGRQRRRHDHCQFDIVEPRHRYVARHINSHFPCADQRPNGQNVIAAHHNRRARLLRHQRLERLHAGINAILGFDDRQIPLPKPGPFRSGYDPLDPLPRTVIGLRLRRDHADPPMAKRNHPLCQTSH